MTDKVPRLDDDAELIHLCLNETQVWLDRVGGRIAQIEVAGMKLLAPVTGNRTQAGCYPMVPWPGRLGHGVFTFEGSTRSVFLTDGTHALHGLAVNERWDLTRSDSHSATLTLSLAGQWGLGGSASVTVDLSENGVTATLSCTATTHVMPAALGWHPCFVRTLNGCAASLDFSADGMWVRGEDYLPTGVIAPVPPGPWDDCMAGVRGDPLLRWGDTG